MRRRQVGVIGSGDDDRHLDTAMAIGRFIARDGWVTITGGGGGIMGAASRGAAEEHGTVIGILPDSDHGQANASPRAVRENLAMILPALQHAIEKIKGDPSDCARPA